ncbi:polysaccharide deacetylase family protein [Flavihumibacter cheonanensis]|jgi:peptidoglycan/xylan/chitin deacetylase (PgdA/CDA1 family)|uniref:polysaccharide deacetylase family protein n=1 Tax=Flavihumibacter cheonanensis TaxID=1442385 RepID=UPI001EF8A65C|nr:polysaccharide deacetylase family protein [Flavihumibacter cheonanensis]MCG7753205.1 polysaccharide deacetylase family protein [Flavihumibacter cheonanensis]
MLTFKRSSALVLLALLAIWLIGLPVWVGVVVIFVYIGGLVWGSIRISSQFYMPAICSGKTEGRQIAISFDDGPLPEYTAAILDSLAVANVPACFFCIGKRVEQYPDLASRIVEQGHTIGNHSYSHHALFDLYSSARMKEELEQTNRLIYAATKSKPAYFRPPYGVTNPNLAKAVKKTGMTTIGWNIRSLDTVAKDEKKLLEKLWKELRPGAILLFHDTMAITAAILPEFLQGVRARGYEIVPIDQLINEDVYA